MRSSIYSSSHITIKCSVTLLQNGVSEIGRRSSSVSGLATLPIGVTYSNFQCSGHSNDLVILLMIFLSGAASSIENYFIRLLGRSPGTPDFGFFADFIFCQTSSSLTVGEGAVSEFNLTWTLAGSKPVSSGGKELLISAKWSAILSADCRAVRFSEECPGKVKLFESVQSPG